MKTTEPETPTDLTVLMSIDPLELTRQDLDQIIAYQRRQRAQREGGAKTRKPKDVAPKIDIKALLSKAAKPTEDAPAPAPRPAGGTFRRRF